MILSLRNPKNPIEPPKCLQPIRAPPLSLSAPPPSVFLLLPLLPFLFSAAFPLFSTATNLLSKLESPSSPCFPFLLAAIHSLAQFLAIDHSFHLQQPFSNPLFPSYSISLLAPSLSPLSAAFSFLSLHLCNSNRNHLLFFLQFFVSPIWLTLLGSHSILTFQFFFFESALSFTLIPYFFSAGLNKSLRLHTFFSVDNPNEYRENPSQIPFSIPISFSLTSRLLSYSFLPSRQAAFFFPIFGLIFSLSSPTFLFRLCTAAPLPSSCTQSLPFSLLQPAAISPFPRFLPTAAADVAFFSSSPTVLLLLLSFLFPLFSSLSRNSLSIDHLGFFSTPSSKG